MLSSFVLVWSGCQASDLSKNTPKTNHLHDKYPTDNYRLNIPTWGVLWRRLGSALQPNVGFHHRLISTPSKSLELFRKQFRAHSLFTVQSSSLRSNQRRYSLDNRMNSSTVDLLSSKSSLIGKRGCGDTESQTNTEGSATLSHVMDTSSFMHVIQNSLAFSWLMSFRLKPNWFIYNGFTIWQLLLAIPLVRSKCLVSCFLSVLRLTFPYE